MGEEKRQQTREKIMQTALALFSREGYHAVTIRTIASEAKMALGLMYSYFSNKEELLKSLLDEGFSKIRKSYSIHRTGRISEDIHHIHAVLLEHGAYWRLFQSVRIQEHLYNLIAVQAEEVNLYFLEQLRATLKADKAKNPRSEARLIWSALDGLSMQNSCLEQYPTEKALKVLLSRY